MMKSFKVDELPKQLAKYEVLVLQFKVLLRSFLPAGFTSDLICHFSISFINTAMFLECGKEMFM